MDKISDQQRKNYCTIIYFTKRNVVWTAHGGEKHTLLKKFKQEIQTNQKLLRLRINFRVAKIDKMYNKVK